MQIYNEPSALPFYREPAAMTSPGPHAGLFGDLPQEKPRSPSVSAALGAP